MTTVAAMICADGLVMGSDTKVVGDDIKWSAHKLRIAKLGKSPLVIGGAGTLRHIQDAMEWLRIDELDKTLGKSASFDKFLDAVLEVEIPSFARDYKSKYDDELDLAMLIGCINPDKKPKLVMVQANGDYDHITDVAAIGSGSIFGEILLRKLYSPNIKIDFAKKLIGYIIWEIQTIDNNSGEDMQIVCIGSDRKKTIVSPVEIAAYKELPKLVSKSYDAIRKDLALIDIERVKEAIETMQKTVETSIAQ
ncbi:MAG: hypothetical protein HY670_12305 [Chloroflexi bacterium]|nr:hypothetical protein [Chloroflexota bacterium]